MSDYETLKIQVIGHVYREWDEAFGEWLGAPERTKAEIVESLHRWAQDSEIMEACELTPEDALEWRREHLKEQRL